MTNQQTYPPTDPSAEQPERVTSNPVPVPPPSEARDRVDPDRDALPAEDVTDRVPEEALDDRGTFEDPALAGDRVDPDDLTAVRPADDRTTDEPEVDEPEVDEPVVDEPVSGGPVVDEPVAGLWGEEAVQGFRDRWRDVQLRFIDDPAAATQEAGGLVDEAVESFTAALQSQRAAIETPSGTDTEQLRVAIRQHRDFLDRLLGL